MTDDLPPFLKETFITINDNEKFIYMSPTGNRECKMELTIELNEDARKRILIMADVEDSRNYLAKRAGEGMEKFKSFEGLLGLKAVNLRRKLKNGGEIGGYGQAAGASEWNCQHLQDGDIINCDLESVDIWINLRFKLQSSIKTFYVSLDAKVDKSISILELRKRIEKLGIALWNSSSDENEGYLYVLNSASMTKLKLNKGRQESGGERGKFLGESFLGEELNRKMNQEMVGQLFGYEDIISINISFHTLEERLKEKPSYAIDESNQDVFTTPNAAALLRKQRTQTQDAVINREANHSNETVRTFATESISSYCMDDQASVRTFRMDLLSHLSISDHHPSVNYSNSAIPHINPNLTLSHDDTLKDFEKNLCNVRYGVVVVLSDMGIAKLDSHDTVATMDTDPNVPHTLSLTDNIDKNLSFQIPKSYTEENELLSFKSKANKLFRRKTMSIYKKKINLRTLLKPVLDEKQLRQVKGTIAYEKLLNLVKVNTEYLKKQELEKMFFFPIRDLKWETNGPGMQFDVEISEQYHTTQTYNKLLISLYILAIIVIIIVVFLIVFLS